MKTIRQSEFLKGDFRPLRTSGFVSGIELSIIERLIRRLNVKSVLEIGVNRGESAKVILDACPQIVAYTGIEITLGGLRAMRSWQVGERQFDDRAAGSAAKRDRRFSLHISPKGSGDFRAKRNYDLVFIDGNHASDWVRRDTALANSARPSVIVWHDYPNLSDVARVVNQVAGAVHVQNTRIAFKILRPETGNAALTGEMTPRAKALAKLLADHYRKTNPKKQ